MAFTTPDSGEEINAIVPTMMAEVCTACRERERVLGRGVEGPALTVYKIADGTTTTAPTAADFLGGAGYSPMIKENILKIRDSIETKLIALSSTDGFIADDESEYADAADFRSAAGFTNWTTDYAIDNPDLWTELHDAFAILLKYKRRFVPDAADFVSGSKWKFQDPLGDNETTWDACVALTGDTGTNYDDVRWWNNGGEITIHGPRMFCRYDIGHFEGTLIRFKTWVYAYSGSVLDRTIGWVSNPSGISGSLVLSDTDNYPSEEYTYTTGVTLSDGWDMEFYLPAAPSTYPFGGSGTEILRCTLIVPLFESNFWLNISSSLTYG